MEALLGLVVCIGCAMGLGLLIQRFRPAWHPVWVSLLAALPLPGTAMAWSLVMFVGASNTPQSECGTDACGMTIAVAMMIGMIALLVLVLSWIAAFILLWRMSR